ncbi:transposase family protein [Streptomyces cynarae]|uniref:transposase family protein n=1 Tax=Streptomyces cynarae TaxID=2981134 RepID=UPI0036F2ACD8
MPVTLWGMVSPSAAQLRPVESVFGEPVQLFPAFVRRRTRFRDDQDAEARSNRNRVRMPSSLISTLARQRARMPGGLLDDTAALVSLTEILDAIPDPRRRRGCRYGLGLLLLLCLVAVLAGAPGWAGIVRVAARVCSATRCPICQVRNPPRSACSTRSSSTASARTSRSAASTSCCRRQASVTAPAASATVLVAPRSPGNSSPAILRTLFSAPRRHDCATS